MAGIDVTRATGPFGAGAAPECGIVHACGMQREPEMALDGRSGVQVQGLALLVPAGATPAGRLIFGALCSWLVSEGVNLKQQLTDAPCGMSSSGILEKPAVTESSPCCVPDPRDLGKRCEIDVGAFLLDQLGCPLCCLAP